MVLSLFFCAIFGKKIIFLSPATNAVLISYSQWWWWWSSWWWWWIKSFSGSCFLFLFCFSLLLLPSFSIVCRSSCKTLCIMRAIVGRGCGRRDDGTNQKIPCVQFTLQQRGNKCAQYYRTVNSWYRYTPTTPNISGSQCSWILAWNTFLVMNGIAWVF